MASGWVKSLQCKTNAVEDVYHQPSLPLTSTTATKKKKKKKPPSSSTTTTPTCSSPAKKTTLLPLSCGNSSNPLKHVVHHFPKSTPQPQPQPQPLPLPPKPTKPPRPKTPNLSSIPSLTELRPGHSSRRVVEIIFSSTWSPAPEATFPGHIEMLFKVHNPTRTVTRFEEYRSHVRARAGPEDPRCAADGNEMMRFSSAPARPGTADSGEPIYDAGLIWSFSRSGGMRTFAGSGAAHERGGAGGRRKAMLVCRVIAGRVRVGSGSDPERYESVSVGKGELVVFDPRAVLPCFLIIYQI